MFLEDAVSGNAHGVPAQNQPDGSEAFLGNAPNRGDEDAQSEGSSHSFGAENSDHDDFQSARSHQSVGLQGLIQEEPAGGEPEQQVLNPVAQNVVPQAPPGPRTSYSEEPMYDRSQWETGRTNRVMGKYWKTFGERKRAIGGGFGGFFGALFGRGMRRANDPMLRWEAARKAQERARRTGEREADRTRGPLRSALKTRLANPDPIRNLSTFPREPGVQYDEAAATAANQAFMNARSRFRAFNEEPSMDLMMPEVARQQRARQTAADMKDIAFEMKGAYRDVDRANGTRQLFSHPFANPDPRINTSQKLHALVKANTQAGVDMHANQDRVQHPRVRFKDGADDQVGLPVNDPTEDYSNKPMPTGVRFHPAPIGKKTLRRNATREYSAFMRSPEFTSLSPEQQAERGQAKMADVLAPIEEYADSLGATGHPDEISDQQAVAQERFAWPERARMQRMRTDPLYQESGVHMSTAARLERDHLQNQTDPLEDDAFREHTLKSNIADEVIGARQAKRQERRERAHHIQTANLSDNEKGHALRHINNAGGRLDPDRPLDQQSSTLPLGFFDLFLHDGFGKAEHDRQQAVQPQPEGGAGLIQEEPV